MHVSDNVLTDNYIFQVRIGLIAPLLIRHPTDNKTIVNFNIFIPECIREVEYMWQFGLRKYFDTYISHNLKVKNFHDPLFKLAILKYMVTS